jgi:hypothetical protein
MMIVCLGWAGRSNSRGDHARARRSSGRVMAVLLLCPVLPCMPAAGPAFEATGYVTYTRFDLAGQPDGKSMRLFVANVVGSDWHIRTEPGIRGPDTVAFGEATATPEQEVVMLLGLPSPGGNSHPALAHLRHELEAARHSHLVFVNPPIPPLPAPYAALVSPVDSTQPESTGAGPAEQRAPDHGILATATVLRGSIPLAEGMHVPLIRFALTPPAVPAVGQAGMLPQVWDDGNREVSFREATWEVFPTPPHLVASAVFRRKGVRLRLDGSVIPPDTTETSSPDGISARYEVKATTNHSGLTLPLRATLTRFAAASTDRGEARIRTAYELVLMNVTLTRTARVPELVFPSKTRVNDYRVSAGELRGKQVSYVLDSGPLPTSEQVRRSEHYALALADLQRRPPQPQRNRLPVVLLLAVLGLLPAVVLWRLKRTQHAAQSSETNQ